MIHFQDCISAVAQPAFSLKLRGGHAGYMNIMYRIIEEKRFVFLPGAAGSNRKKLHEKNLSRP
jgi:hypothetical protein